MRRQVLVLAVAGVFAAMSAACDSEDNKTYDVTVSWNIGGAQLCSALVSADETVDFEDVTITVYENEGDEEAFDGPFTVPCESFSYDIPRLDRGTYWVEIEAWGVLDDMDLPIYSQGGEVRAPEEQDDGYSFGLMQSSSAIKVVWDFEAGMCGANGIENVVVNPGDEEIPCDDGFFTIEDLVGFSTYTVSVDGLDAEGEIAMSGTETDIYLRPGEVYESFVILE